MRPSEPDTDDTVRVMPMRRQRAVWPFAVAVALAVALAGAGAFWLLRPQPLPAPPIATAPIAAAPKFDITTATESEIAEHVATSLTVFRFADNPRILVLDFASLHEQGEMLNRVAAFTEKAGLPHDRVLTDRELDEAIRERGDTVETFYFGHDYAAKSVVRFFAFADNQRIRLNPQEEKLRALLRQEGWFAPDVTAGLISVPAVGSDPRITPSARVAILRHELSHGEFFSETDYADFTRTFWLTELTEAERGAVRGFLANEGYDPGDEELMFNEMQAYLMFTRDPTFFKPDMVGMTPDRLAALQEHFVAGMPASWLRDVLASYAIAASAR
jgi:hypothetical protein